MNDSLIISNKIPHLIKRSSMVFISAFIVLLFTDFSLIYLKFFVFISLLFLVINSLNNFLSIDVYFYTLCLLSFGIVAYLFGAEINGLLVAPLISFLYYRFINAKGNGEIVFNQTVRLITVLILLVSVIEIAVKLNLIEISIIKDFVSNHGDKRLDVLRVRTLFGSSLSTAALTIFLSYYFIYIRSSFLFLLLTLAIAFLSGSRTAIVLIALMLMFSIPYLNIVYRMKVSKLHLRILVAPIVFLMFSVLFLRDSPVGKIISRAVSIKKDASFTGRSNTSLHYFYELIDGLPSTLFTGLAEYTSDSAFVSISAGSGILLFFLFFCFFVFKLLSMKVISIKSKFVLILVVLLGGSMIGDFFVPAVSLLYFTLFYIYSDKQKCI